MPRPALTADSLADAAWPRESIDAIHTIPRDIAADALRRRVAGIARAERLDRIVALDDFDVETAAMLREHLRTPGMGRRPRAVPRQARDARARSERRHPCPISWRWSTTTRSVEWTARVRRPWVMKPRSSAAAIGIKKSTAEELWRALEAAGEARGLPVGAIRRKGDVYHVDSIVFGGEIRFAVAMKYGRPPMEVAHEGGIFITRRLPPDGDEAHAGLLTVNQNGAGRGLGLQRGVSHTEFIRARRRVVLPRNVGPRRRRLHRRRDRGGDGHQPLARVGEARNRWRRRARYDAPPLATRLGRHRADARAPGGARPVQVYRSGDQDDVRKRYHAGLIVGSPTQAG